MNNTASALLINCITDSLPRATHLINPLFKTDGCYCFNWMDGNGDDALTVIIVDRKVTNVIQAAVDQNDEDHVVKLLSNVANYIVYAAVKHDDGCIEAWGITEDVLIETYF